MRFHLWQKLLAIALIILTGAIGVLTYFTYQATREAMLQEFHIRGRELAKAIASESKNYYHTQDVEGFTSLLQSLGEAEGVLAILGYDATQSLWIESSIVELTQSEIALPSITPIFQQDSTLREGASVSQFINVVIQTTPDTHPDILGPQDSKSFIGWIRILLDRYPLEKRLTTLLQHTLLINGLTTLFGGGILIVLLRQSLKIIKPLTSATQEVAKGNLTISVPVTSHDELGQLATCFNQMTQRLHDTTVSKLYVDNILKSMIDSLIVIDPGEKIHSANQAALTLLGYQESEIIGQESDILFPQKENPFRDREFHQLLLKGTLGHIETHYLTKEGLSIPVLFSAAIMKEYDGNLQGIACVAQNITNRKQAEKALRESVERFDMAVKGSQDGIWDAWAISSDWFNPRNPVYFSPRFKALLGFQDHEFDNVLESWASQLHPEDREKAFRDLETHLRQSIPYDSEYRMITKDGECRWYAGRGEAVRDDAGQPVRISGSFTDITERKQAQGELEKANDRLKELDQLRSQFFADISHELRTPLTVIRGEAEVTLRGKDKPIREYKTSLEHIVQLTEEVNKLVNDLLFLARSETGTIQITKTHMALEKLSQDVLQEALILALKKHIEITLIDPPASIPIYGDPQRVKQLLLILIDNAIKYSAPNSKIHISLGADSTMAQVVITDNGRGIPQEDLQHVFKRFYRVRHSSSESTSGAGLGLAIAKWITEAHQGKITMTSTSESGTTVTILLPLFSSANA